MPRKNAILASLRHCLPIAFDNLFMPAPHMPEAQGFRAAFNMNASEPDAGGTHHDPAALWQTVTNQNGQVTPEQARAFVDSALRGRFANEARITDPRAKGGLSGLDFETQIALYEAIGKDKTPQSTIYLRELNKAMNPGEAFYERRVTNIEKFFDPAQTANIELRWNAAKAAGSIPQSYGSFADTMNELLSHPPILSANHYKDRVAVLQFVCDSYSEFIGESSVRVGLFQGQAGMKGFFAGKDSPQGEIIGINVIEMHDFRTALNIMMHERQHASQERLALQYDQGKIKKGDAEYQAARMFSANRAHNGYMMPDMPAGPQGYIYQPMEVDAHNAGNTAEYHAGRTYARPPKPHTGAPSLRAA